MKNEIDEVIGSFVNKRLSDKIKEILTTNKNAIILDFNDVDQFSPELGDYLLKNPEEALDTIKYFINETSIPHKDLDIEVRIKNLPKNAQLLIREIRSKHIGLFIQVQGLIKTAASVKPVASAIDFECQSCGHITKVEQKEMTQRAPSVCTNCGKKGRFKVVKKYLVDTQRIMLEEAPEDLEGGEQPEHINVVLKKDLVDPKFERNIIPGNKVVVSGIINESAIYYPSGKRSNTSDTFILASYVEAVEQGYEDIVVTKEEEMAIKELANDKMIYTKFKNSIAPNIFGHDDIKEAIVMQLFGGVRKAALSGNSVIRGDIHILLVGDPGCLRADERIVLGNGAIIKIGNAGKTHLEEINQDVLIGQGYKRDTASTFHIYKNQQVMEIVTESGKSIVGTFNHPLLVKKIEEREKPIKSKNPITGEDVMLTKKVGTEWKRLDEIKKGDYVRTITWIPCTITKLAETGFTNNGKSKLPKFMTEKLAALIGYMIGNGWVNSDGYKVGFVVYSEDKDILSKLNSFVKSELNIEPHTYERTPRMKMYNGRMIKSKKKLYYVDVDSKIIAENFSFLKEKRVPDSILKSGNKVFRSFLRWIFEADGSVVSYNIKGRKSNGFISYKSVNLELLRDIQIMLLRFSIQSRIVFDKKSNGNNLVIRKAEDILKFYKKIGFASKRKTEKLKNIVKSLKDINEHREKRFERVVEVRKLGKEDVYDIEVPKSHRFIANGIVSHNTSKSSLLKYVTGIAPKARYVVGMGSSAAGLTATIIKDEATRSYILEAGALPLTNKGLLMIDELDKMNKDDRVAMHEALEQQSYSYDSRVLLSDGSEVEIGKLVEKYLEINRDKVIEGKNCEILDAKDLNIKLLTTDFDKIFETNAFQLSRHKAEKTLITIEFANGRRLTVTPNHPIWIFKDGEFKTISAEKLEKGMQIPIPSFLPISGIDQGMPIEAVAVKNNLVHNDSSFCRWMGYLLTDGSYELNRGIKNGVNFTNTDINLIKDFFDLTYKIFNVKPYVQMRPPKIMKNKYISKTCYFVRAISKSIVEYLNAIDNSILQKSDKKKIPDLLMRTSNKNVSELLKAMFEGDGFATKNRVGLVSSCRQKLEQVSTLLLRFGITSTVYEEKLDTGKPFYKLDITGIKNLIKFKENVGFISIRKNKVLLDQITDKMTSTSRNDSIDDISKTLKRISDRLRIKQSRVISSNANRNNRLSSRKFRKLILYMDKKLDTVKTAKDTIFSDRQIDLNKLIKIRMQLGISCLDLGNHSEVSSSLINYWENKKVKTKSRSHKIYQRENVYKNALIKIINEMEETTQTIKTLKGLAVGDLTLTKIKGIRKIKYEKEFVYDVGVLPTHTLIVNGIVSHNSISISKANIHATLTAQTSVLAAANPKLGRFNPFDVISSQIELPPTLINRFDLIFILKDRPDKETDTLIAQRILEANRDINKNKPEIPPNIMKKYIAYAKQNIKPKMSVDAMKVIQDFYLKLRSQYSTEGEEVKPIPISARQLEAVVRLTEASAKVRLSDYATVEDAKRAIDLMMAYLGDVGIDSSTGQFDIDRITTGISSSQRNTVLTVKSMIKSEIDSMPMGSSVPLSKIYEDAEKAGIDQDKVDSAISVLKREGEIFEPKPSFIKLL